MKIKDWNKQAMAVQTCICTCPEAVVLVLDFIIGNSCLFLEGAG